jgi:hypothetical protein
LCVFGAILDEKWHFLCKKTAENACFYSKLPEPGIRKPTLPALFFTAYFAAFSRTFWRKNSDFGAFLVVKIAFWGVFRCENEVFCGVFKVISVNLERVCYKKNLKEKKKKKF